MKNKVHENAPASPAFSEFQFHSMPADYEDWPSLDEIFDETGKIVFDKDWDPNVIRFSSSRVPDFVPLVTSSRWAMIIANDENYSLYERGTDSQVRQFGIVSKLLTDAMYNGTLEMFADGPEMFGRLPTRFYRGSTIRCDGIDIPTTLSFYDSILYHSTGEYGLRVNPEDRIKWVNGLERTYGKPEKEPEKEPEKRGRGRQPFPHSSEIKEWLIDFSRDRSEGDKSPKAARDYLSRRISEREAVLKEKYSNSKNYKALPSERTVRQKLNDLRKLKKV